MHRPTRNEQLGALAALVMTAIAITAALWLHHEPRHNDISTPPTAITDTIAIPTTDSTGMPQKPHSGKTHKPKKKRGKTPKEPHRRNPLDETVHDR